MFSQSAIVIRDLRREDIQPIAVWMVNDAHWVRYGMTVESITSDLNHALDNGDIALVADIEGRAAGFAWCIVRGMFGTDAYLKRIGIDPALTGHSLGSSLLAEVEHRAVDRGATMLTLLVGSDNSRAEQFYRRHGYALVGALPDFAIAGIEERVYRKRLVPLSY